MEEIKLDDRILVVIPYLAGAAQGKEIKYAVAGWRKHFKENYLIVVVGDYDEVVDTGDDIIFINCPRIEKPMLGNYRPHLDHVNKFRTVRKHFPDSKGFIYTCDDIYAVNDFTIEDVLKPKIKSLSIHGTADHKNAWIRDNVRTKEVLVRKGFKHMNWVCHLPVYYEWDKLFAIYDGYGCDKKSYVVEQLYFNTYFADSEPFLLNEETDNIQFKMWRPWHTIEQLKEAMTKKIWISNSVKGYKPEIEDVLREHYGLQ